MRKSDKSFVMTLGVLMILIGCGVHSKLPANTAPQNLFEQEAIVYRQDTIKPKQQLYNNTKAISDLYKKSNIAFDQLNSLTGKFDAFVTGQTERDKYFKEQSKQNIILFTVANKRRIINDSLLSIIASFKKETTEQLDSMQRENRHAFLKAEQLRIAALDDSQINKSTFSMFDVLITGGLVLVVIFSSITLFLTYKNNKSSRNPAL